MVSRKYWQRSKQGTGLWRLSLVSLLSVTVLYVKVWESSLWWSTTSIVVNIQCTRRSTIHIHSSGLCRPFVCTCCWIIWWTRSMDGSASSHSVLFKPFTWGLWQTLRRMPWKFISENKKTVKAAAKFLKAVFKGIGGGNSTASTAIAVPMLIKSGLSRTKVMAHSGVLQSGYLVARPHNLWVWHKLL